MRAGGHLLVERSGDLISRGWQAKRRGIRRRPSTVRINTAPTACKSTRATSIWYCESSNAQCRLIAKGEPAMPDGTPRLGMRVRFSPDFYITRAIPECGWTGIIKRLTWAAGQRTYTVELDPQFRTAEETEVDALAEEMEPHETNEMKQK